MYRMVMLTYTNPMHILDLMMGFPNSQANGSHQPGMIVLPPCPFYFIIRFTSAAYFMFAIRIIVYIYIYIPALPCSWDILHGVFPHV